MAYNIYCSNGRLTIERRKEGVYETLSQAKSIAVAYVDMYCSRRLDANWAKQAIRAATLAEFDDRGLWISPDF